MRLDITAVDTTFVTRDHFMASFEMQLSGEPFAETMGRALTGYSRDHVPPNIYFDPTESGAGRVDLAGFSTAVESYEYSKQPMNNLTLESGAGTSLLFGPVLNPNGATGMDALALMQATAYGFAGLSNATSIYAYPPSATYPLSWPGLWPIVHPFVQFDPTITATDSVAEGCSITSDDDPGASGALQSNDYECDYASLHLPNRDAQVTKSISPGASGWLGWKQALWALNYLQIMHDGAENAINTVPASDLPQVGQAFNTIMGDPGAGNPAVPGVYFGSSNIEGFQAGMFLTILDNQAADWLSNLTTTDGATLTGFPSVAAAQAYTTTDPLQWFPGQIGVTEDETDASGFPRPTGYAIESPDSHLLDQAGLLGAFASIYALTDTNNALVGGSQPALVYFTPNPTASTEKCPIYSTPLVPLTAPGQPAPLTLHDRALAMIRVLVVNMDRLHTDPASGVFVDDVAMAGGTPARGATLSADAAAYALLSLRTARRTLDSSLALYSNTRPDTAGIPTPLDAEPAMDGQPFGTRLDALIDNLASVFYDKLTDAAGVAYAGWDVGKGAPTDAGTSLDAHAAAIRGLLVAYLSTGNPMYRDRARLVYQRLEASFYDPAARIYRLSPGDTSTTITFTPRRFSLLQAALRDSYELIGVLPGQEALGAVMLDRVARLNKLVLNGWDDRNQDEQIDYPDECAGAFTMVDVPGVATPEVLPTGGLQMAERTLSGESGSLADVPQPGVMRQITVDRDNDCVPEISAAKLPAALASAITFTLSPLTP